MERKHNPQALIALISLLMLVLLALPVFADGEEIQSENIQEDVAAETELTEVSEDVGENADEAEITAEVAVEEAKDDVEDEIIEETGPEDETDEEEPEEINEIDLHGDDQLPSYKAVFEGVWDEETQSTTWEEMP